MEVSKDCNRRLRLDQRGFALAYFLVMAVLIVMMTATILILGREGLRATRGGVDDNRALAAAEAGVALLTAELERDPEFNDSYSEIAMPDNTATYSAQFAAPDSAGPNDCINNLSGNTAVDSYRGPGTVPPHSALLVVTGQSGTSTRAVEVLVVSGFSVMVDQAITATGEIDMSGHVVVNGWKSLLDASPVPASFHSNSEDSGMRVKYSPGSLPGADLKVEGRLTSSSADPESTVFQVGSSLPVAKLKSGVPQKALPRPNVQAVVGDQTGTPGPTIPSAPGPVNFNGNNYYAGAVTINGDVTMDDNAGLYVDGDLVVNGSILGKGKVVVTGNTTFYGEAEVAYRDDDYISLLSGGHIVLKGFKGQQYLENLTGSGLTISRPAEPPLEPPFESVVSEQLPNYPPTVELETAWYNLRAAFTELRRELEENPHDPEANLRDYLTELRDNDNYVDNLQSIISSHLHGSIVGGNPADLDPLISIGITDRTHNSAGALRMYMEGQGGGHLSATRFLSERLLLLEDLFRIRGVNRDGSQDEDDLLSVILGPYPDWDRTGSGPFDTFQSTGLEGDPTDENSRQMLQAIYQFDYDRLGSANFKGIVYSGGAFVATDDVVVRGTVIVNGDPGVDPLEVDLGPEFGTKTFQPGDVGLYGYTTFTYVEELFDDGVHNLAGAGTLDVKRWVSR